VNADDLEAAGEDPFLATECPTGSDYEHDSEKVREMETLEAFLRPWLEVGDFSESRSVTAAPAGVVVQALRSAEVADAGTVDGLPSPMRLASFALELNPEADLHGLLIALNRRDTRLHLNTIHFESDMNKTELRKRIRVALAEDEAPDSIERLHRSKIWELWWD
jgi:hypothetical protein